MSRKALVPLNLPAYSSDPTYAAVVGDQYYNTVAGVVKTYNGSVWTSAAGTAGAQGIQGTQGIQGLQGPQGLQGTTGTQGNTGTQGTVGTQGTQGLQGLQGTLGLQGTTGLQGTQGTTGPTGVTSATAPVTYSLNTVGLSYGSSLTTSASNLIVDSTVVPYLANANTFTNQQQITAPSASTKGLIVKAAASQTANLQEWQDSAASVKLYVDASGALISLGTNLQVRDSTGNTTYATINSTGGHRLSSVSSSTVGLIVRGAASQSSNLQEWQNSGGTTLARIWSAGELSAQAGSFGGNAFSSVTLTATNAASTYVGLLVKGAASQTADLQQWQNSAGSVLSKVTSSGAMMIGTETVATREYVQSRGMNMVANGFGMLGNNYNFSTFTFDATDVAAGKGSFITALGAVGAYTPDEFIPVDPQKAYRMQWSVKQRGTSTTSRAYGMVVCYDIDGAQIRPQDTMRQTNTDTTLAADLKPGDTTVYLTSAANWNNAGGASTHLRTIIVWGYTNSFGYTYPNYTYSRKNIINAYADGGVNYVNNTITLSSPWPATWGTIPAGTAISNGSSGGTFKYIAGVNFLPSSTSWTTASGEIQGVDTSGGNLTNKFSPGTAFVKVGYLLNYAPDSANSRMAVSATSFSEVAQGNLRVLDSAISGDTTTTWFQVKNSALYTASALNVDLTNNRVGIATDAPSTALTVGSTTTSNSGIRLTNSTTPTFTMSIVSNVPTLESGSSDFIFKTQGVTIFNSNGGNGVIGNGVPSFPRGVVVNPLQTNYVGLVVKGLGSQTSDLQQWQNSAGNVVAKVTASGSAQFVSIDGGTA